MEGGGVSGGWGVWVEIRQGREGRVFQCLKDGGVPGGVVSGEKLPQRDAVAYTADAVVMRRSIWASLSVGTDGEVGGRRGQRGLGYGGQGREGKGGPFSV